MDCTGCGSKCCRAWGGSLWSDPITNEDLDSCPYLLKDGCSIYPKAGEEDMRPRVCREYPFGKLCLNQTMAKATVIDEDHQINIACYIGHK